MNCQFKMSCTVAEIFDENYIQFQNVNKVALISCESVNNFNEISLKELFDEYQKVSYYLQKHCNNSTQIIGVLLDSKICLAPIILGSNKLGHAFMCLSFENGISSLPATIYNLGISWILTDTETSFLDNINHEILENLKIFNKTIKMVRILDSNSSRNRTIEKDLCYVIKTSGTTGDAKLVKVTNQCIMANISYFGSFLKLSSDQDKILLNTPLTFDPFIVELFLSLTKIIPLVICDLKNVHNILEKLFFSIGVTVLQVTPSVFWNFGFSNIKNIMLHRNSSLKTLMLGGEKFPDLDMMLNLLENSEVNVYNVYGVTEVSCWASIYKLEREYKKDDLIWKYGVPLGRPVTDWRIMRNDINEGELLIDCTDRVCYVENDNPITLSGRFFRKTGDYVYSNSEYNDIYYVGRKDCLVKRFGHRFSLDQVNSISSKFLNQPIVSIFDDNKLVLFLTEKSDLIKPLKQLLLESVSKAAIVDRIEYIPNIPLTINGKLNKNELKRLIAPQRTFKATCCEYLDITEKDFDHSFQFLGGTSIIAMQIMNHFETERNIVGKFFDNKITLNDIFKEVGEIMERRRIELPTRVFWKDIFKGSIELIVSWKYNMGACVDASPTFGNIKDKIVITIGSHSHKFSTIELSTGDRVSEVDLGDRIEGTAYHSDDATAIVGCYNGFIYKINLKTESIEWSYKTGSRVKATPCLINDSIVIGSYDHKVHCLNFKTGNLNWETSVNGSISTKVVVCNQNILVGTINGFCYSLNLNLGKIIWEYNIQAPIFSDPCIFKEMFICATAKGHLYALDCNKGAVIWSFQCGDAIYSSLRCLLDNKLYFGCYDNCFYELEISRNHVQCLRRIEFDSQIFGAPCFVNTRLCVFATMKGYIYILDTAGGIVLGKTKLPGEIFSAPCVIEHTQIVIGCRDDFIYCLNLLNIDNIV